MLALVLSSASLLIGRPPLASPRATVRLCAAEAVVAEPAEEAVAVTEEVEAPRVRWEHLFAADLASWESIDQPEAKVALEEELERMEARARRAPLTPHSRTCLEIPERASAAVRPAPRPSAPPRARPVSPPQAGSAAELLGPAAVREQLIGCWKLLLAPEADAAMREGVTAGASAPHLSLCGHFQTFSKPDPMDVLTGKPATFMETCEVVADSRVGRAFSTTVKGGFHVDADPLGGLRTVEIYTQRDGAEEALPPNRWNCAHVGSEIRVARAPGGGQRVYCRVDAEAMRAELARLAAEAVEVDPKWAEQEAEQAAAEGAVEEVEDNRPLWQKRIDEADGIQRSANGTPIINHGPIGGSNDGPRTQ